MLAYSSKEAYEKLPTISGPDTDTQVLITETSNRILIAFRGSESIQDWIEDSKFVRRNWNGISVHEGFSDALEEVFPQLHDYLVKQTRPIIFCGHSLGGALAILAAWYARRNGSIIEAVYTFGQPRVGDHSFKNSYFYLGLSSLTWRVVNDSDIVPRLPGLLIGYRDVGNMALLNGKIILNPSFWKSLRFGLCLTDHECDNYIAKLNRL
jgi:hypothetical protein